jgi:hypothetical protein
MPTKTERIIANLPGTFKPLPRPTTLFSVIDAFGGELLNGENSLAAVMLAHWVDHADRGAEIIDDLARIGALYGLAPRPDESVEEFREHLKRYIRTFIEGTVTVQGALRVAAEALALRIADRYEEMDTWWNRPGELLTTMEPRGDDAAVRVLGFAEARARGHDALAARVEGEVDLDDGIDLTAAGKLHLKVDGGAAVAVDLLAGAADGTAVTLDELASAINGALGFTIAGHDGRVLRLVSPTSGAGSRLEILDGPEDAATAVLGLPPRRFLGRDASAATVSGTEDLSGTIDLSAERYLRLFIDGAHLAEIDCAGSSPAATTLDEVRDAINAAFSLTLASHDGASLTLTSPTTGLGSRIEFKVPAAQDATARLFGQVPALTPGSDPAPARLVGRPELGAGVDLASGANLALKIDGSAAVSVNCAGADPSRTQLPEIVTAVNAAFGGTVASHNGRRLILASPTVGATGSLEICTAADGDASERLLGLKPRSFHGAPVTHAQVVGLPGLEAGIDLAAVFRLQLALDDGPPVTVDLCSLAADRRNVTLAEMADAVNAVLGVGAASHDGRHLILTSPTSGADSSLAVLPLDEKRTRRFVTRTPVIDEAAPAIFGVVASEAAGSPATPAQLTGKPDLSRGVDLRAGSWLRLALDGAPAAEIDCAGPRPRATTLDEIVAAINLAMTSEIASHDGKHLVLTSPTAGAGSRIAVQPSRARDAGDILLGIDPTTARGRAATSVAFTGTVDLMEGIELPADAAVSIGIDGAPPVEIALTGSEVEQKSLNQLMLAINLALGQTIASHDGIFLSLASPSGGEASIIEFAAPAATDATALIFGIAPPRSYQGRNAAAAVLEGVRDLSGGVDLQVRRFLQLGVDATASVEIDCASGAADPAAATLDEIIAVINSQAGFPVATHDGVRLTLTSPSVGAAGRLILDPYTGGDAAADLLGAGVTEATGMTARPAILTGTPDLLAGVDLSQRRLLRLAVDGGRAADIDVAGVAPGHTFGNEIVVAINRVFPGLAVLTEDDRLELTSPTAGEDSRVSLLPLRWFEVIEYPPESREYAAPLRHGESFTVDNEGASSVFAEAWFSGDQGVAGPGLADLQAGWRVTLLVHFAPGERARLRRGPGGELEAEVFDVDGRPSPVPAENILVSGDSAAVLQVPQGISHWVFLDCLGSRFDRACFDKNRFPGGFCLDRGVFDISRFGPGDGPLKTVFAWPAGADPEPAAEVSLHWVEHLPGAFTVNLPADLAPRFGGRFNQARFALDGQSAEFYPFTVTEPAGDPDYLPDLLNASSNLIKAKVVDSVPLGWQAVAMPFRKPRGLTVGSETQAARIYLSEEGIAGFLELEAKIPGAAGNSIRVAARKSGPALFDVTVVFDGGRFEMARQVVLGEPLPALTSKLLQPGPVGLLQAKAGGVRVGVTREKTNP